MKKKNHLYTFLAQGSAFLADSIPNQGLLLKIFFQDGNKELMSTSVQSFLLKVVQFFGYDIIALRKQYGQALGKRQMVPIPLLEDWILIPCKTSTLSNGEFLLGWIVAQAILHMEEESKGVTKLYLKGGHSIFCGHRLQFCQQQLRNAALAQHRYLTLHQRGNSMMKEEQFSYFI